MRINTNLTAMNTQSQVTKNQSKISGTIAKLSSGYAINTAADNAAGLAISEKMRAQIRGLSKASSNAQDAISLAQTAEGALDSSTQILQRMRELAVQSSSDTNNDAIDRTALHDEFSQLQSELNNISSNTAFNKKNLLDGSLAKTSGSIKNTNLASSSLAIFQGNAAAGSYSFNVGVKKETAASASKAGTTTASLGTTAAAVFSSASGVAPAKTGELYNGNYTLSTTVNSDASLTVTARGDNGQTFTASLSSGTLAAAASSTANPLTLNFESAPGAGDGFGATLTLSSVISTTSNGLNALAAAINDTKVSVGGGVDAKAETFGVYANLTGADSVKLQTGDSSVTFSNGVKVSFDTLTASDIDTVNKAAVSSFVSGNAPSSFAAAPDVKNAWNKSQYKVNVTAMSGGANKPANGIYMISAVRKTSNDGFDLTATNTSGDTFTASMADPNPNAFDNIANFSNGSQTFTVDYSRSSETFGIAPLVEDFRASFNNVNGTVAGVTDQRLATCISSITMTGSAIPQQYHAYLTTTSINNATHTATIGLQGTDGTHYTATVDNAAVSALASGATFNADFYDASSKLAFTATYTIGDNTVHKASVQTYLTDLTVTGGTIGAVGALTVDASASANILANQAYTTIASESGGIVTLTSTGGTALTGGAGGTAVTSLANTFTLSNVGHNYDATFGTGASSFDVTSTANKGLTFQVGANEGDTMTINIEKMDANYLGVASASVATQTQAGRAIKTVDAAITQVSSQRATLGALQNRLTYKIDNLNTSSSNLTSAESQIRDVDMAKEMTAFTNVNILGQASTAMLAQANSLPQNVLSLLK